MVFEQQRAEASHEADLRSEGYHEGFSDGEDEGYRSGYEDGYADGYAAGHQEAQHHSETFDRLMREAYAATGGAGAGFKKDPDGKVYYLETTPSGREIWVPFEP